MLFSPKIQIPLSAVLIVLSMFLSPAKAGAQSAGERDSLAFARADWKVRELARGAVWKSGRFSGENVLFGSPARIEILRIDQSAAPIRFAVAFYPGQTLPTSRMAVRAGALAAVNGTYFQTKPSYAPTGYFKVSGTVVNSLMAATGDMVAVDTLGKISVERLKKDSERLASYPTLMAGAPVLLWAGDYPEPALDDSLRAPRTAIGQRDDTIWIVVVDGRSSQAAGMTLRELAHIFRWLGADKALNLDGGGSTTLYVRGGSKNGVVNTPSDRLLGIFPGMERPVGNALLLLED